ncbi:PAS domain S-box protein [Frigidibacter sp.]|uniref:PAS domain S-box protein n=1 Tax=Frigidibacter sp. TaxID=2586418 RepID=UPI00273394F3|nr:PAS domain S-box protein [Frigidibacter sp.]MDP3341031.1 PAS domain S-box protein [Frigidibacter sp.]
MAGSEGGVGSEPRRGGVAAWLAGTVLLALAYALGGLSGTALAVPPGYATIIWPASGIALAALLLGGRRLWPGVFLGSFLINCHIGGVFERAFDPAGLLIPALIAIGAMLQALLATTLVRRRFGRPLGLGSPNDVFRLVLILGPLGCLISPTFGTTALWLMGSLQPGSVYHNWQTWWLGDLFGVLIVVPLTLFAPWRQRPPILWRGHSVARMSVMGLLLVSLCLGATFYAWATLSHVLHQRNSAAFTALVDNTSRMLSHRLQSYSHILNAGSGLLAASERMEAAEWRRFVAELDISETLPGLSGLGLIRPVAASAVPAFEAEARVDLGRPFNVHPDTGLPERYVVRQIEPHEANDEALGIDLGFEQSRRVAVLEARDSGRTTISAPLVLVQDPNAGPGFVLLRPVYSGGGVPETLEARRATFAGWVYAPFAADPFFRAVIGADASRLSLTVEDRAAPEAERQVFSSAPANPSQRAQFAERRTLPIHGREWRLSYASTPAFDASVARGEPTLVLLVGFALSGLIGTLLSVMLRRAEIVTELVETKTRELATQEEHTRSIIDTAMVGILLLDAGGRILALNRAAEPIFGAAAAELIGRPLTDLVPIESIARLWLPSAAEAAALPQQGRRFRIRRGDGLEVYIELQLNSWRTDDGQSRFTAIIRDITVRQLAEMRLQQAERRLNMALTGAHIAVFDVNLVERTQIVSDNWLMLMGYPPETSVSAADIRRIWEEGVYPEDRPLVTEADRACIAGETERSVSQYRVRLPDGRQRWMRSEALVPERDDEGQALRLLGVQIDVTELQGALDALSRSEAQFRSVIELAPVGMALLDRDGRFVRVNEALCRFTGYGEDELCGSLLGDLAAAETVTVDPEVMDRLLDRSLQVHKTECAYLRRDGRTVWGLLSISLTGGEPEDEAVFIAQIQDITDRKEMEQIKSDFVATVSHELRTPLTSIKGALGLVLGSMSGELPPQAERLLSIGQKNCDRLITLVNDILDLEKISSGQSRFTFVEAEIGALVEQSLAATQPFAADLAVTLQTGDVDPSLQALVDVDRFQQVMANLLSNAAKFSPRGGTVEVGVARDGRNVRVTVTDHGTGIPADFRDRIFLPFSQADSSSTRAKGGTGLGLNISRQIVERMDGDIGFDSAPGETVFWFVLPLSSAVAARREGPEVPAVEAERPGHVPVILHVEDDGDFAEVFRSAFGAQAEVLGAASLAEARPLLRDRRFDLIVIDWELPDGSGIALLDQISQLQPEVPVYGLSARDQPAADPRVRRHITKSRARLDQLVADFLKAAA